MGAEGRRAESTGARDDGVQRRLLLLRRALKANPGTIILSVRQHGARSCPAYVWGLLIAAAAGGLLAALAAFLLARRISRPVDRIATAARTLAGGTHPEPVPVEGATEIATLAGAFNDLVAQLQRAQEAERNFLLSVSHELKTPLTAIRGYAEAVEDGAIDPQEAAATVAPRRGGSSGSSRDLLDLARMNRTDFNVHNTEIDLAEVAEDAVRRYGKQAAELRRHAAAPSPRSPRPRSRTPTACSRSCRTSSRTRCV